jgi:hypothetical protein
MGQKPARGKAGGEQGLTAGGAVDLPERRSAQRQMELALAVERARGEDGLDAQERSNRGTWPRA